MRKKYGRFIGALFITKILIISIYLFLTLLPKVNAQTTSFSKGGMYPDSTFLTNITWDTNAKKVTCGDNSAATWSGDDSLYATLGDCQSSFNVVKIDGIPYNVTSSVLGSKIDGTTWPCCGYAGGKVKGSGILAIGSTQYVLGRNWDGRNGVGLVTSSDGGKNYTFNPAQIKVKLGYPVFLNAGKGYANAPDNYVYIWGHGDDDTAYAASTKMHMLRVPQGQILNKSAYQYYTPQGNWAATDPGAADLLTKAGTVFDCGTVAGTPNKSKCDRSGITYNYVLGRYIVWMSDWNGTDDFRDKGKGGFGVYESATPWDRNSWRTVWHTPTTTGGWSLDGIGDAGNFTTKWMSSDGRDMYLVYGGTNYTTIRKATFTINGNPPPTPINTPTPVPSSQTSTPVPTRTATANPTQTAHPSPGYPPIDYNDDDLGLAPTQTPVQTPAQTATQQPTTTPRSTSTPQPSVTPPPISSGDMTVFGLSNGQTVSGTINVEVQVAGGVDHIDFILDGNKYNSEYIAPYNFGSFVNNKYTGFNTSSLSNGNHTLTIVAYTSNGTHQTTIQFNKGGVTTTPNVTSKPTATPVNSGDQNILITGISSGQKVTGVVFIQSKPNYGNISHVDFYVDNSLVNKEYLAPYDMGSFVNNKPAGYDTSKLSSGSHTLIVKVTLDSGQVTQRQIGFNK